MQYVLSVPVYVYAWVTIPTRIGLHVYIIKLKVLLVVRRIVLWHIFSYGQVCVCGAYPALILHTWFDATHVFWFCTSGTHMYHTRVTCICCLSCGWFVSYITISPKSFISKPVISFKCPNTRVPMNAIPTFITRALHLAIYVTEFAKTRTYGHNGKNFFHHQSIGLSISKLIITTPLLKVDWFTFSEACFWGLSDVHECSGVHWMATGWLV